MTVLSGLTEGDVALGGAVELDDVLHVEAVDEVLPHGAPHAVADHEANAVLRVRGLRRCRKHVAADLTDVLHHLPPTIKINLQ